METKQIIVCEVGAGDWVFCRTPSVLRPGAIDRHTVCKAYLDACPGIHRPPVGGLSSRWRPAVAPVSACCSPPGFTLAVVLLLGVLAYCGTDMVPSAQSHVLRCNVCVAVALACQMPPTKHCARQLKIAWLCGSAVPSSTLSRPCDTNRPPHSWRSVSLCIP